MFFQEKLNTGKDNNMSACSTGVFEDEFDFFKNPEY